MRPETRSFYEQAVQRAIEHIAGNLDAALDLGTLAAGACLSPFTSIACFGAWSARRRSS
jgi:hypothetical protein